MDVLEIEVRSHAEHALLPSRHLLGEPMSMIVEPAGEKAVLLGCDGCGDYDCWPLYAQVDVENHVVRWSRFEQPHRANGKRDTGDWDYAELGPFLFDRAQYEAALRPPITPP